MGKHRDWTEIAEDYRVNGLSYAALAKKYDVPLPTLKKAAIRQGWARGREEARAQAILNAVEEIEKGTEEMVPDENGTKETVPTAEVVPLYPDKVFQAESDAVKFHRLVDSLMDRVEDAICNMDVTSPSALKLMTSALKDLRDLKHLNKTKLDIEEQMARIEKLRSETRIVEDTGEYGVIILPQVEEVTPPE